MTTGFLIRDDEDATGWHVEAIRGIACCGRRFDLADPDVEREAYDPEHNQGPQDRQTTKCFDCVGQHGVLRAPRPDGRREQP